MCKRNIDQLSLVHPQLGTWPTAPACALTEHCTGDLAVHTPALGPLSHTSQGTSCKIFRDLSKAPTLGHLNYKLLTFYTWKMKEKLLEVLTAKHTDHIIVSSETRWAEGLLPVWQPSLGSQEARSNREGGVGSPPLCSSLCWASLGCSSHSTLFFCIERKQAICI